MKSLIRYWPALAAATLLLSCSTGQDDRPNILLVTFDTQRWDYLNPYGFEEENHTPSVNRLAENGTVYRNAVSTAGTTIPSHGSMLTGVYARQHGARSNFHHKYPKVGTVTSSLRDAGYQTGAFVTYQILFRIGGLGEGFDTTNYFALDEPNMSVIIPGDSAVDSALEWFEDLNHDKPFFSWLHIFEPHGPYEVNEWSKPRLEGYDGILKDGVTMDHIRFGVRDILDDPAHVEAMKTIYAGEVWRADRQLGRFLEALEQSGELDNTIVIFTADHGQSLGENKRMGHGPVHRETVLRVPLIVADFRNPEAREIETRAGTIDIAPTIAEVAGLDQAFDAAGQSLVDPDALDAEHPYFGETAVRMETDRNWERVKDNKSYDVNALAVYAGDLKMIQKHGKFKLYRTAYELDVAEPVRMRKEPIMADYMKGLIESFQQTPVDLSPDELSTDDLEALQGLGYTQ